MIRNSKRDDDDDDLDYDKKVSKRDDDHHHIEKEIWTLRLFNQATSIILPLLILIDHS